MDVSKIIRATPFMAIFPIDPEIQEHITKDMQENGYDPAFPVTIWGPKNILIDGNTRLLAAQDAGINDIPVEKKSFSNQDKALEYAIHCQRDRRNISDAELFSCIEAVDKRKRQGERTDLKKDNLGSSEPKSGGPSAEKTADIVGTSVSKVKKARVVMDHADADTQQAVKDAKKTINKAYTETVQKRKGASKTKQVEPEPPELGSNIPEPGNALECLSLAIPHLRDIGPKDPRKDEVFDYLNRWIKWHRSLSVTAYKKRYSGK